MARRPTYPDATTAVSHYTSSVTSPDVQARWGTRCAEGASKLGDWFNTLFPDLYRLIAKLPTKPKDPWAERSKPVGKLISETAEKYRGEKVKRLARLVGAGAGATPA